MVTTATANGEMKTEKSKKGKGKEKKDETSGIPANEPADPKADRVATREVDPGEFVFAGKPAPMLASRLIPLAKIVVDPAKNARDHFGKPVKARAEERKISLADLENSIRRDGLKHALEVRPIPGTDTYELVAGYRRYLCCEKIGYEEVQCYVSGEDGPMAALDEYSALESQLVENVVRSDYTSPELAMGLLRLKRLAKQRGEKLTDEQIAARVSRSRPNVCNLMRAAKNLIPEWMGAWKGEGGISIGDKEAFELASKDADEQRAAWEEEVNERDGESGGRKGGKTQGGKTMPMMRREGVDALFKAISTRPTFEAMVAEAYLGSKTRYVEASRLSDEALSFGRALLATVLNPKGRTPALRYREEEEDEGGDE